MSLRNHHTHRSPWGARRSCPAGNGKSAASSGFSCGVMGEGMHFCAEASARLRHAFVMSSTFIPGSGAHLLHTHQSEVLLEGGDYPQQCDIIHDEIE